jgi:replicative DNA helicase
MSRPTVAEERLLELLLANQELRKIILPKLEPADYEGLASAEIFRALISLVAADKEIGFDSLSSETADDPRASELMARLMMTETSEAFDESLAAAESCLNALHLMKLDRHIDELSSELAEAERAGDAGLRDRLAVELLETSKQRGEYLKKTQPPPA